MSNELSIFDTSGGSDKPAHLAKYVDKSNDAAGMVTGFASLPKMSIKGKQFRYMKEDKEYVYPMGTALKCIILATDPQQGVSKAWYNSNYNENAEFTLPDCFSSNGIKPDAQSTMIPKGVRSCAECPKNAFGSGKDSAGNPTKGKACADVKNLFIVEAHQMDESPMVLRVPATSLKALSGYGRLLAKQKCPPQIVVTKVTFTDATHPQLEFAPVSFLSEADADNMIAKSESDDVQLALPSRNIIELAPAEQEIDVRQLPLHEQEAPPVPEEEAPPVPQPKKVMTQKANGLGYDAFIAQKWTDKQLIENGYMEIV
jgi:hypothetical protein